MFLRLRKTTSRGRSGVPRTFFATHRVPYDIIVSEPSTPWVSGVASLYTEEFYRHVCGAELGAVLDTLEYLSDTDVWVELTTLLIPGLNDSDEELDAMTSWVVAHLGPDVPMHFTAFHPDYKMLDVPATPASTLARARQIAVDNGVYSFCAYNNLYRPRKKPGHN